MRTISSITEEKISRNLWLLFLANEINITEGDITGPTAHVQIMLPLKDKNARYLKALFSGTWMNNQSKIVKLCDITRCIEI